MKTRYSSKEFRDEFLTGNLIPTRRGIISATPGPQEEPKPTKKKQKEDTSDNRRYLKSKTTGRLGKKGRNPVTITTKQISSSVAFWKERGGIFIPYDVSSFKNSKQVIPYTDDTGKSRFSVIPSEASLNYRRMSQTFWLRGRSLFQKMIAGKSFPVTIGFYFIRKRSDGFDYQNMVHFPFDLMTDYKWIPDDNNRYVRGIPLGHEVSPACPGVVIFVMKDDSVPWVGHPQFQQSSRMTAYCPELTIDDQLNFEKIMKTQYYEVTNIQEEYDDENPPANAF